ncbi:hypothetical protein N657DRAFT_490264 [Parathielavia appendiculata]|uniref:Uncharacterized protein n=1 Tax=Parathielavia appendiculata TaxID=2587402 RepID=A0AAN6TNY8_9PEZI|nr:hypothetical protein N657DRAFT_490264 [Parathielavia appendiculata]
MSDPSFLLNPVGIDVRRFIESFGLDYRRLLAALAGSRALVTGREFLLLMAGLRDPRLPLRPGAIILDVLCYSRAARSTLELFFRQAGYAVSRYRCRHNLGEWSSLPAGKVVCLVRGQLSQRVVHLLELKRPPTEVVLSRTYGSMAGTYLTGTGSVVSLFPHLTFVQRRCWIPHHMSRSVRAKIRDKYQEWSFGERRSGIDSRLDEVGAEFRSPTDSTSWTISFTQDGAISGIVVPSWVG